jgi:hypothetical protein
MGLLKEVAGAALGAVAPEAGAAMSARKKKRGEPTDVSGQTPGDWGMPDDNSGSTSSSYLKRFASKLGRAYTRSNGKDR